MAEVVTVYRRLHSQDPTVGHPQKSLTNTCSGCPLKILNKDFPNEEITKKITTPLNDKVTKIQSFTNLLKKI